MKLSGLHLNDLGYYRPFFPILEGYGRVHNFNYDNFNVDPRPKILLLGRWRHPRTRNNLIAGINLNYLDDEQVIRLRRLLPSILKSRNLKNRYWAGRMLLPDIFNDLYRTYDSKYVHAITPATLKFWKPEAEKRRAAKEKERELRKAKKQIDLGVEPEPEKKVMPKPEIAKPEIVPEPEEPEEPEVEPEKETSKERRERERAEAEAKRAERGTRSSRELEKDIEQAEEPE